MESSSTSSIQKSFKYDVFLSFRGEDTRKNFIDHLYDALTRKGINTYKDDESINKGKNISDELIRSIEDSKFYIIAFSKNYASSSWCLEELVKIMECQKMDDHTAYPVFFDVEPTQIRKQSGCVKKAFAKHKKEKDVGKWRDALKEAADLAGWELKNTANGHEAKFIQEIVEKVSLELRCIDLSVDGKLVGMEARVKNVVSFLETSLDDVRMIGIKGMGGAGKTTLARAVFDQISFQFEGSSFVENVREVSNGSSNGLCSLQKQVLSSVLNDQRIIVSGVSDGKHKMRKMMRCRKVLVVLDDVDHIDQLEALAGEPNWFKPGSRVIITTRDEQVLAAHRVSFINVNLLSRKDAICLFSRHAFGKEIPIPGYEDLSKKVVQYAAGLPLTVKVLGSFLCGKSDDVWTDAIERLKTIPLKETLEKLELSYTGLEDDYKEIFLDVACILKGWKKDQAITALESCGFHAKNGLKVLEQKSLLTISMYGYLGMHDHIEAMGKNIVRRLHPNEPHKHSRLWIEEEIEDILDSDSGIEATRCITLRNMALQPATIMKGLLNMKYLRFLKLSSNVRCLVYNHGEFYEASQYLPNALQFLSWSGYPFTCLPKNLQVNNLVGLEMHSSSVIQLWEPGEGKVLKRLRFIDLSYSMLRILDLRLFPNLEMLILQNCHDMVELDMHFGCQKLRIINLSGSRIRVLNLGRTPNLEILNLENCNDLVQLHMHGECLKLKSLELDLPKLRTLDLAWTPKLKHLRLCLSGFVLRTLDLVRAPNLETLCVRGSSNLKRLETFVGSICNLRCLRELKLAGSFSELPTDLNQLECLEELVLLDTKINHLPNSICILKHLKVLRLEDCYLLEQLPEDLGRFECLEEITFTNTKFKQLPNNFCMLKHLKVLRLKSCMFLEQLPENLGRLECLEELVLSNTKIKHLPNSICMLKHLKVLRLEVCQFLEQLPEDLGRLQSLEKLIVSWTKIKHLPNRSCMLKHLKILKLSFCGLLEQLPEDLGRLERLEELELMKCLSLSELPNSICEMKHLKYINISDCIRIKNLPEKLACVECLEKLNISGTGIFYLPHSSFKLKGLHIYGRP